MRMAAAGQPATLPGVRERWKFIEPILDKAPAIKIVPMLGSLGCPYTCAFCIDSVIPYQPLGFEQLGDDLSFLLTKFKRPLVGWHDPNFGVRFEDYMNMIESAVPPGSIDFIAESSLSLLTEPHLQAHAEERLPGASCRASSRGTTSATSRRRARTRASRR